MNNQWNRFIRCACGESIPLPRPSLEEVIASQTGASKVIQRAVFLCTECGLASAYTSEDVQKVVSPFLDPYQQGICVLGYIELRCDEVRCGLLTRLYFLATGEKTIGEGIQKVQAKDWRFAPSATCTREHALRIAWDKQLYTWQQETESPL